MREIIGYLTVRRGTVVLSSGPVYEDGTELGQRLLPYSTTRVYATTFGIVQLTFVRIAA